MNIIYVYNEQHGLQLTAGCALFTWALYNILKLIHTDFLTYFSYTLVHLLLSKLSVLGLRVNL